MLLATATTRFDAINRADKAMYDLFRHLPMVSQTLEECQTLWN